MDSCSIEDYLAMQSWLPLQSWERRYDTINNALTINFPAWAHQLGRGESAVGETLVHDGEVTEWR